MKNLILLVMLLFSSLTYSNEESLKVLMDSAGQQRMLSQKCAKAFVMVGIPELKSKGEDHLEVCRLVFARNYKLISNHSTANSYAAELKKVKEYWDGYNLLLSKESTPEAVQTAVKQADILLVAAQKYVEKLQIGGSKVSEKVALAGHNRMLSQRIARNYLIALRDIPGNAAEDWLKMATEDISEIESTLDFLQAQDPSEKSAKLIRSSRLALAQLNGSIDGDMQENRGLFLRHASGVCDILFMRSDALTKSYTE